MADALIPPPPAFSPPRRRAGAGLSVGLAVLALFLLACTCSTGLGPLWVIGGTETPGGTGPAAGRGDDDPPATPTPTASTTPTATPTPPVFLLNDWPDFTPPLLRDPYDLACRLRGACNLPRTFAAPWPRVEGEQQTFWALDDRGRPFQVQAVLCVAGEHAYHWVDERVGCDRGALRRLAETFDHEIYPRTREVFGSEWSPGVDGDPRLYVLYARGLGGGMLGYFSSADEFSPLAEPNSNAHEIFLINADLADFDRETLATLAHELQHMIAWNVDRDEDTWLDEGLSELAQAINGYPSSHAGSYLRRTDVPLLGWNDGGISNSVHYGASYLFLRYLDDRFGRDLIRAIVASPLNGPASVEAALTAQGLPFSFEDLFADWAIANYLNNPSLADGRYAYAGLAPLKTASPARAGLCPVERSASVNQFGVDYWLILCTGERVLEFRGATEAPVMPVEPASGEYAVWSGRGNEADAILTRAFDLRGVSAPVELTYRVWYDLEENYDYVYLLASTDGLRWRILSTPSGTPQNPLGNSLGWGYTGRSGGWRTERVDLSTYAGQVVQLRFEYLTDAAVNGEGLLLDEIAIPALGYREDFESGHGGWAAQGFVRLRNRLPQTYRLALVLETAAGAQVLPLSVGADGRATAVFRLSAGEQAVLVVSATGRHTLQPVEYTFTVR